MRFFNITVICLALAVASPAFARMYKWTDEDGKVHFSDNLSKVPLEQRNKKQLKKIEQIKGEGKNVLPTALPPAVHRHIKMKKGDPNKRVDKYKKKESSRNKDTGIRKYKSPTTGKYKSPTTSKYKMPSTGRHKMPGTGKY